MDSLEKEQRAERLIYVLHPGLKFKNNKVWSTKRINTTWGTKSSEGLKNIIMRIMYEE